MYAKYKSLTIWTAVLNFLIVIGAGHGIIFLGLIEIAMLLHFYDIGTDNFSLSFTASYEQAIGIAVIFSLLGQSILLFSLVVKQKINSLIVRAISLSFLWVGFFYVGRQVFSNPASQLSFITGVPFLIASVKLLYKSVKQLKHPSIENSEQPLET